MSDDQRPALRLVQPDRRRPPPSIAQPRRSEALTTPFGGRTPITGIQDAPIDTPLALFKNPDGLLRVVEDLPPEQLRLAHEHVQDEPSTAWIVDHNLGRYPVAWSLFDQQGLLRDEYLVETPTVNRAIVRTDVPSAGRIRMI